MMVGETYFNVIKKRDGFTIVELLIVIVVIGILAAITIVAYNGIQNRANDVSVQADLRNIGGKVNEYMVLNNNVTPTAGATDFSGMNLKVSRSAYGAHYTLTSGAEYNLLYCRTTSAFILVAAAKSGNVYVYRDGGVKTGVGPLDTHTATCLANGLNTTGAWFYNSSTWQSWVGA